MGGLLNFETRRSLKDGERIRTCFHDTFLGDRNLQPMAKCDEGYLCQVCGEEVESITDSDLYLRYVLGVVDPELLHSTPERHLACNPVLSQFIKDDRFESPTIDGPMAKEELDQEYVQTRIERVTEAYRRLWELKGQEGISILDFPLKAE